jgi:hypothetical protein
MTPLSRAKELAQRFRSRVVEIEAMLWTGGNALSLFRWCEQRGGSHRWRVDGPALFIDTLEGEMRADVGDWIIRGLEGEFYPCKPSVFARKYEPALPEPAPVREGWQPIETAPKSHRMSVLLLRNDCVTVGWWDGQLTHRRPKPYWHTERGYLFGVEHDRLHQPTHWMPLPSEPRS